MPGNVPQRVEVNCATGEQVVVPLTAEEIAEQNVYHELALREEVRRRSAQLEDQYRRNQATKALLTSPVVSADPGLKAALAYALGVDL